MQIIFDLHSHILPGMDDGSPDPARSALLLAQLAGQGAQQVCATPHYYPWRETPRQFAARRQKAAAWMEPALDGRPLPRVLPGAEIAFCPGLSRRPDLELAALESTRTLLLELPFGPWDRCVVDEVAALVLDRGFRVALAHPERLCRWGVNRTLLDRLVLLGLGLQINADSLCRWHSRSLALELLSLAPHPLLGSDCHDPVRRRPRLEQARGLTARHLGPGMLERIDQSSALFCAPIQPPPKQERT